ncbi:PREDICTED: uncharacterized protein LOC104800761 [Tarenaya hassleriana]|uniref:uncharacterized protein LOC104800761 n=1 Tax=Tarenaya hassleriana TaxID=28532 RepID=UPI00053C51AE|nr:PREDICTED: uncharacterized protein LOC104800761 [Tarenaya hassleriana]
MSDAIITDQISLFLARIRDRRFDEESLRTLKLFLAEKDVKSLCQAQSGLRDIMKSDLIHIFGEIGGASIIRKLSVLEFFARAFALIGDMESCLAVRYEALTLRELRSPTPSCAWLSVSHSEWVEFAEQSLENGFSSIARKACENAVLCLKKDRISEPKSEEHSEVLVATEKASRLGDSAATCESSHSVQAQAAEYLRGKELRKLNRQPPMIQKIDFTGSSLFRDGIKKRNERMLQDLRTIQIAPEQYPHV